MRKDIIAGVVVVITLLVFAGTLIYSSYSQRKPSSAASPITISSPEKGITCASIINSTGVALHCWKDKDNVNY